MYLCSKYSCVYVPELPRMLTCPNVWILLLKFCFFNLLATKVYRFSCFHGKQDCHRSWLYLRMTGFSGSQQIIVSARKQQNPENNTPAFNSTRQVDHGHMTGLPHRLIVKRQCKSFHNVFRACFWYSATSPHSTRFVSRSFDYCFAEIIGPFQLRICRFIFNVWRTRLFFIKTACETRKISMLFYNYLFHSEFIPRIFQYPACSCCRKTLVMLGRFKRSNMGW